MGQAKCFDCFLVTVHILVFFGFFLLSLFSVIVIFFYVSLFVSEVKLFVCLTMFFVCFSQLYELIAYKL